MTDEELFNWGKFGTDENFSFQAGYFEGLRKNRLADYRDIPCQDIWCLGYIKAERRLVEKMNQEQLNNLIGLPSNQAVELVVKHDMVANIRFKNCRRHWPIPNYVVELLCNDDGLIIAAETSRTSSLFANRRQENVG